MVVMAVMGQTALAGQKARRVRPVRRVRQALPAVMVATAGMAKTRHLESRRATNFCSKAKTQTASRLRSWPKAAPVAITRL